MQIENQKWTGTDSLTVPWSTLARFCQLGPHDVFNMVNMSPFFGSMFLYKFGIERFLILFLNENDVFSKLKSIET